MIDRSESDLIAQEQRNRTGTAGSAVHGGDRVSRRKRAATSGPPVRIEPNIGQLPTATPPTRPKQ